jgi:hypothetical protein
MHLDVNAKYQALEVVHFLTHEHNNHTLEVSYTRLWASSAIVPVCSTLTPTILMPHSRNEKWCTRGYEQPLAQALKVAES